jgi:hypothetical protein
MDENLQAQIESYLSRLDGLIRRGRELRGMLTIDPSSSSPMAATRGWQEECGVTVNELSGGSKAHWLARSFSEAFLVRSLAGGAVEETSPVEIVQRLLDVLEQAVTSLSGIVTSTLPEPPVPRRFDFVHDRDLRSVLEQAYIEGRRALDQGDFELAMVTSCGILEAIVTDALEHNGMSGLAGLDLPTGKIADWSFERRLDVAERARLIRGGCARLSDAARNYRDPSNKASNSGEKVTISENDARRSAQVLHVVMRDLNPGR